MDIKKLAKISLGLGGISICSVLAYLSLSELIHDFMIHSLERKIYKQEIKLNNELIKYIDIFINNKHNIKLKTK